MFILQPEKLGQQTRSINNSNFPEPTVWATSDNCSKSYLLKSSFGFLLLLLPINCLVGHFPGFVYHVSKAHGLELSNHTICLECQLHDISRVFLKLIFTQSMKNIAGTQFYFHQLVKQVAVSSTRNPLTDVTSHITTTCGTWCRFRSTVS